jgi:hypothetical protein
MNTTSPLPDSTKHDERPIRVNVKRMSKPGQTDEVLGVRIEDVGFTENGELGWLMPLDPTKMPR